MICLLNKLDVVKLRQSSVHSDPEKRSYTLAGVLPKQINKFLAIEL